MKEDNKIKPEKLVFLDGILELLNNPKKLMWLNFKTGFVRGFAGVIGAAIAIVLIGFLVAKLGGLPLIGDWLKQIEQATKSVK